MVNVESPRKVIEEEEGCQDPGKRSEFEIPNELVQSLCASYNLDQQLYQSWCVLEPAAPAEPSPEMEEELRAVLQKEWELIDDHHILCTTCDLS